MITKRMIIITILSLVAFGLVYPFAPIDPLPKAGLCILIMIAGLWVTEALPIPITALLIPIFATALGVGSLTANLAHFASPVVFLIFGGFILSTVLHKHGLDHWFAAITLRHCGAHTGKVLIGMFIITAFLSMWMSNASATLMMLPILHSVLQRIPQNGCANTQAFALLGLAYASSLGGMVTLVGSPTNMIVGAQLELDFFEWMMLVGPAAVLFFPIMIAVLTWKFKPQLHLKMNVDIDIHPLSKTQRIVLIIFGLTCVAWMGSSHLGEWLGIEHSMDTWIILVAAVIFVLMNLLDWNDIESHTEWGVLLLSGGGMALSAVLMGSGAGEWLAHHVIDKAVADNMVLFVIVSVLFIIFLTEMMSNAAAAALMMPILIITASSLNFPVTMLAPLVGVTASMAFMFPIATPPNAIVYGTGKIPLNQMIRTGFLLNIMGAIFIVAYVMLR